VIIAGKIEGHPTYQEFACLEELLLNADHFGFRMEVVQGLGIWETLPGFQHQRAVGRIGQSIRVGRDSGSDCACLQVPDLLIRFPDGSFKRPDVSIFCKEPEEQDKAVTQVPEAVIEVISRGYEAKDLEVGPPFYLSQGVKDVVVLDPYTGLVRHFRGDGESQLTSPVKITFECGCTAEV
jgi:Uma2 family endonuclease